MRAQAPLYGPDLAEAADEIERLRRTQITADYNKVAQIAARETQRADNAEREIEQLKKGEIAILRAERDNYCAEIERLNDRNAGLTVALDSACAMVNACLSELGLHDLTPSPGLLVSKLEFDKAMRKVLGKTEEESE